MDRRNISKIFVTGIVTGITSMMLLVMVLVFTGKIEFTFMGSGSPLEKEVSKKARVIGTYIDKYYLDEIDSQKMADSIYKGIFNGLGDDYAAYYTADEYKGITEKSSGTYCGIGAEVERTKEGDISIVKPIKGSPAEEAGIKAGDIIYAVDGEIIAGTDLTTAVSKIKGKAGTKVVLKVVRKGENDYLDIEIERRLVEENTVLSRLLPGKTGYIRVTGFEEVTNKQFKNAVDTLEDSGMKSLIIDLRDNGGGLLSAAVGMLDRLLPKGLLVYTKDKNGVADEYFAEDDKCVKLPMAVLVNGNSASASEVFSGALQDNGVAKLVGTKTFGKGIVQTIFGMEDGTALKMTTSRYYTPKGRNIHKTGLEPDIEVQLDETTLTGKDGEFTIDNQLQAAISYLAGK
ncbi:MAG: S41 family peptidase [Lachnospiraceae bacterium]